MHLFYHYASNSPFDIPCSMSNNCYPAFIYDMGVDMYNTDTDMLHRYLPCYIWHMILETSTCHAIFDTWHRISLFDMLCLPHDIWHRYLTCYTCHMIYYTGIWHTMLATWYMTCYTCHLILILAMLYLTGDTRPRYLSCYTYHLILDTDSWYVILDTCSWHPVYDMISCGTNTWTWHHDSWPDITTPDTWSYDIFMTITITGTWHDYYIIITRYLVLLSSCTPVYLNPWNREAPDITPVLYSCWPRNRIIMDIVHLWTPREHYYLRLCHM